MRLANPEFQAVDAGELGAAARQQAVGIMGLQPVAQEFRWHGNLDQPAVAGIELHAAEPAREDVFAEFGAQPRLDPAPFAFDRVRA